jgi:hypothetical protein
MHSLTIQVYILPIYTLLLLFSPLPLVRPKCKQNPK